MNKIVCWCCGNPSGQHKMGCSIKSQVQSLDWLLAELHNVPQDVLNYVSHKIYVESLERKLNFDEYVVESEKLELPHPRDKKSRNFDIGSLPPACTVCGVIAGECLGKYSTGLKCPREENKDE